MTSPNETWQNRTLLAVARIDRHAPDEPDVTDVLVEVALRFADLFGPGDREYVGLADQPLWQTKVMEAVAALREAKLLEPGRNVASAAGRERAATIPPEQGPAVVTPPPAVPSEPRAQPVSGVLAAPLRNAAMRAKAELPEGEDDPVPVMIELNGNFRGSVRECFNRLAWLWRQVKDDPDAPLTRVAGKYVAGELTTGEMKRLVAADAVPIRWPKRSIYHIWPDFVVRTHTDESHRTIKMDAARRTFNAYGRGIVWAVIDTGIDARHPHFSAYGTLSDDSVQDLHRFFPPAGKPTPEGALEDPAGHGTHVAGIIAGAIGPWLTDGRRIYATESRYNVENPDHPMRVPRQIDDPADLAGMAPLAKLVSLRALGGGGRPEDRVHRVIQALAYVREVNERTDDAMRIHGVNLSVGYEFDPEWFACGRSPLCEEIDRLVKTGVVVVVAAGNSGYGTLRVAFDAPAKFGFGMTINDPGNAELAITVGSTHRSRPFRYGVSYFSSKGPTGDGRAKPDLIAPGEQITSCAAGENLTAVLGSDVLPADAAVYVQDSGTSMAAPHVSGAVAALLSIRPDFVGEPQRVKEIFVRSATDLGRRPELQGAGLLDMMRALQRDI